MRLPFPILIFDSNRPTTGPSLIDVGPLVQSIEKTGASVQQLTHCTNLACFLKQCIRSAAIVLLTDEKSQPDNILMPNRHLRELIQNIRSRSSQTPIFLYCSTEADQRIAKDLESELHGVIHELEDTHGFNAKNIVREAQAYIELLKPPFFSALQKYTNESSASWHCPGHSGGTAFLKSPAGQLFHEFFGENMLRADVCNAVDDLGQLLDHTGPVEDSENNAAKVFQADQLYFVTNGTSSSNRIVWNAVVSPGDVVVVDRNCHKSIIHAIILTGAIPVFLKPTRNHLGIIGPVPKCELVWESIQRKIKHHPLIDNPDQKPKIICITQSTYDGVLYNAKAIQECLDGHIDVLHFDEAWSPHASFHGFYENFHALDSSRKTKESIVFATQSTHKLLAGLSQASQILVKNATNTSIDHHRFNEAYLMHSSTSPHYPIIASCDITAAMMKQPGGSNIVEETLEEAIAFRQAMQQSSERYADSWWFELWEPPETQDANKLEPSPWRLDPTSDWHGFSPLESDFNMLDPIKVTITTPGLSTNGEFNDTGIPASVAAKYLAEHGVIVEKVSLYSFLIMFTIGITRGRWNTLVTALQRLKKAYDENTPLVQALPDFIEKHLEYKSYGIADLCQKIHLEYKRHEYCQMISEIYDCSIQPAMTPSAAYAKLTNKDVERVPISELEGRISTMLITPYPPGIPMLIPGERFNRAIVNYLQFMQHINESLPGFQTHIHGLIVEPENQTNRYYVDCVIE